MNDAAEAGPHLSLRVVRGIPTPEEVAALIAVVGEEYDTEAREAVADEPARSRWEISARSLRMPLRRDRGWSGFSG